MSEARKIRGEVKIPEKKTTEARKAEHIPGYKERVDKSLSAPATEILQTIFAGALRLNASDIHLEPEEEEVRMRIRMDGILHDVLDFSPALYDKILSRIKLLGGLKLNISDRPQDGRFSIVSEKENLKIEARVSALPSEQGEAVVMRLLNPRSLKDIEGLGLREDLLATVKREIKRPNGMVVATGPTGCGKTTSLYAFCKRLNEPEIKIITIEDPIEYHLEGISQTQVEPEKGYSFASGLRSIVRQDPDIILVGEMRDKATVQISLQAGLTGHLVLTTLHTNDAAGVVVRLLSLGGKPANIGGGLSMVIGQRLVRKVCPDCKKMEPTKEEEREKLRKALENLPPSLPKPKVKKETKIPKAKGCRTCNSTGYRGRTGIFEILVVDEEIERMIIEKPSIAALREKAEEKGMTTMKEDGFLKVLKGTTTIEEVERVAG